MVKKLFKETHGFTLLELMIASTIFATILVLLTYAMLAINKDYTKATNNNRTQLTARSLVDTISQAIQFSNGQVIINSYDAVSKLGSVCFGDKRLRYTKGFMLSEDSGANNSKYVALLDDRGSGSCLNQPFSGPSGDNTGQELLTSKMRLANLSIVNVSGGDLYQITLRIVYGDDDLLCDGTPANCANIRTPPSSYDNPNLSCKNIAGKEYCAAVELSTTVQKRVQ